MIRDQEIDFDYLFSGEEKISFSQMSIIEDLLDKNLNIIDTERHTILQEYKTYSKEYAGKQISYLKRSLPLTDCRDQFKKMCKDGVFKTD
tara:strand:+ start:1621 stop:1890 length:270 start_codon:yes stop_codon:yes gene_type:complete